jgi:hypothetical protein
VTGDEVRIERGVPADIRLVKPGAYTGKLVLPEPGRWVIVVFSADALRSEPMRGYPRPIELMVSDPAPRGPVEAGSESPIAAASVIVTLAVGALVLLRRRRRTR